LSKSGAHVAGIDQVAIEFEGPFVVGAHQLGDLATGVFAHLGAAMATGVVERPYLAILAAHDGHRVITNLQGEILASLGNLEGMPGEHPILVPDLREILPIDLRIEIELTRQHMARFALLDQANHGFIAVHYYPPDTAKNCNFNRCFAYYAALKNLHRH
jgi:hypothetical protein